MAWRPTRAAGRSSAKLAEEGNAKPTVTYRLRDWLISRQRYWGTPIPVIYCERDGIVPVPEEELPVRLPDTVDYRGSGENPLARDEAFLNVTCPEVRRPRPPRDRHDGHVHRLVVVLVPLPVAREERQPRSIARWSTSGRRCEQYTGGSEHAVMHLLYAREFTKMMRDIGARRPGRAVHRGCSTRARSSGMDGERMSKSRGNTEDPDELVARYGADTIRLFLMFMGPWDQGGPWSPTGHRWRPPFPQSGLDGRPGSQRPRAGRPG